MTLGGAAAAGVRILPLTGRSAAPDRRACKKESRKGIFWKIHAIAE